MKTLTAATCLWMLLSSSFAIAADSTSLFNTAVLGTSIQQGTSVTPVGAVITWTSKNMPNDAENWLECDGRAIPSGAEYQSLRTLLMSNNTPNYNNQFLRGGVTSQVGQTAADSLRSHTHSVTVGSQSVTGTVSGGVDTRSSASRAIPRYIPPAASNPGGYAVIPYISSSPDSGASTSGTAVMYSAHAYGRDIGGGIYRNDEDYTSSYSYIPLASSSSPDNSGGGSGGNSGGGSIVFPGGGGGSFSGYTSGGTYTTGAFGGAETAPQHMRVRYLIRAKP